MKKDSKEAARMEEGKPQIIQINKGEVHAHVDRLDKQTVEEMINGMLDVEADRLCWASRYKTFSNTTPHCGGVQSIRFESLLFLHG